MKTRFCMAALSCAVLFTGLTTAAQAAEKLVGKSVVVAPALAPANSNPGGEGIFITSTTIGDATTGVPCYGVNTGCSPSGSIAIPYPLVAIPGGTSYYVTVQLQSTTYSGLPTVNITMTEGGTTIATGSVQFDEEFGAGYIGYAYFTGTLPSTPGTVTISSTITTSKGVQIAPGGAKFSIY